MQCDRGKTCNVIEVRHEQKTKKHDKSESNAVEKSSVNFNTAKRNPGTTVYEIQKH